MTTKLLTARQVAAQIQVSTRTVTRWAASGRLPCRRVGRKCVRFEWGEVTRSLMGKGGKP